MSPPPTVPSSPTLLVASRLPRTSPAGRPKGRRADPPWATLGVLVPLTLTWVTTAGCGGTPRAVRDTDAPGLDQAAVSTGLDRADLDRMYGEIVPQLDTAAVQQRWAEEGRPTVAILPFQNETTQHLESQLGTLASDLQTRLVNSGRVRVIDIQTQPDLIDEVRRQNTSGAFDSSQVASWGRQLGARYVVTGRLYANDERAENARRVQYTLFVQILAVETSEIVFQARATATKAIVVSRAPSPGGSAS